MSSHTSALRPDRLARPLAALSAAAVVAILGAFVYQAGLFEALTPRPPAPGLPAPKPGETAVTGSRAAGFDRENQPYEVIAASALQDEKAPDRVHLKTVGGTFRRASGEVLHLSANAALYDTSARVLDLDGDVTLASEGRFTARMTKAQVTVDEKKLTSAVPVAVAFSTGMIDANGVEITDDGKRILFLNGVRAKFRAGGSKGDGTP